MIIAFVNTKGGTGKSTGARNFVFSTTAKKTFRNIAFVEFDTQGTNRAFFKKRRNNPVINGSKNITFKHIDSTDSNEILEILGDLDEKNDLLVLDVPGESKGKFHTRFACAAADIVIIPMRKTPEDEDAFEDNLLPIVEKVIAEDSDSKGKFYILPTFTHHAANKEKIFNYIKETYPNIFKILGSVLPNRPIYEDYSMFGTTIYEYKRGFAGKDKKLLARADALIEDIESMSGKIINIIKPI